MYRGFVQARKAVAMPSPMKDQNPTKDKSPLLDESRANPDDQTEPAAAVGQDNAGFEQGEDESGLGPMAATVKRARHRGSEVLSLSTSSLLSIPEQGVRRHSVAASANLLQPPSEERGDGVRNLLTLPDHFAPSSRRSSLRSNWSELEALASRRQSQDSITLPEPDEAAREALSAIMTDKLKDLARRFSMRTDRMKEKVAQPATPSTGEKDREENDSSALSREDTDEPKTEGRQHRLASFIPGSSMEPNLDDLIEKHYCGIGKCKIRIPDWVNNIPSPIATFEPQSRIYLAWLALVTTAYVYNAIACTLRPSFVRALVYEEYPWVAYQLNWCNESHREWARMMMAAAMNESIESEATEKPTFEDRWNLTFASTPHSTAQDTLASGTVPPRTRAAGSTAEDVQATTTISSTSILPSRSSTPFSRQTSDSRANGRPTTQSRRTTPPTRADTAQFDTTTFPFSFENSSVPVGNETELNETEAEPTPPLPYHCNSELRVPRKVNTSYKDGYETESNRVNWWIVDYSCDALYLIDILLVKPRVRFINNGMLETELKQTAKSYFKSTEFKLDVASLTPLDLFYLVPAFNYNAFLRLPRILKIHILWELFDRLDQVVSAGYMIRVTRTLMYMLYLVHLQTCGYYYMSAWEGLNFNEWVYNGKGDSYLRSMFLCLKTATSIGYNPKPDNTGEYFFMTVYWLSGVFVFAMLLGQVRDIFQAASERKLSYRRTMDDTLDYMHQLHLPKELQRKVRLWFNYTWEKNKALDENSLLDGLPLKMRADMAIHVHFQTLSKVQLFQDAEKSLLFDLVLKLQPTLYLPGDYICKKGEVGTEMYIIKEGKVDVVGGPNDSVVFVTLGEGSVFGEISLMSLAGGNRRTASVKSKGFSNLFTLSKTDFEEAMADYPDAYKVLKRKAKKILTKNAKKDDDDQKMEAEEVIKKTETPKMVRTVIQMKEALDPESKLFNQLRRGSRRLSAISTLSTQQQSEIKSMVDLKDPDEFEDEILVVETTERDLTPEEQSKLEESERQNRTNSGTPPQDTPDAATAGEPQKDHPTTVGEPQKEHTATVGEPKKDRVQISVDHSLTPVETPELDANTPAESRPRPKPKSPRKRRSPGKSKTKQVVTKSQNTENRNNSSNQTLSPPNRQSSISATFQYESDFSELLETPTPGKSAKTLPALRTTRAASASPTALNRKATSPGNGAAPVLGHNKVAPLDVVKSPLPPIAHNQVAPFPPAVADNVEVPPENRVVCTADIHREKSPSINSSIVSDMNALRD